MDGRLDLPGGGWAELREPEEVSERLRRAVQRAFRRVRLEVINAITAANDRRDAAREAGDDEALRLAELDVNAADRELTPEEVEALSEANDRGVVAFVKAWSMPAPITLDAVVDLPHRDYAALREAVAPLVNMLWVSTDPDPDPASPTAPSGGSSTTSPEGASTTHPSTGAPTS